MKLIACFVLVLNAFILMAQTPTSDKKSTKGLHLVGCPIDGVEGCIMLVSDNKVYDITSAPVKSDPSGTPAAKPNPAKKLMITVDANSNSGGVSVCQQAPLLKDIDWKYSKQGCPLDAQKKAEQVTKNK